MDYVLAVFDIGKTNKKLTVYDQNLRPLATRKTVIETLRRDGLDIEDVDGVEHWLLARLKELGAEYPIRMISICAHGATVVCVGQDRRPCVPPVAYTNEVPPGVHERFWRALGGSRELQERTATAEIKPLVNVGKLLWYLKERYPKEFDGIRHILFYPQYFGYRLTGRVGADITYVGCHTYLWDFGRGDWSVVADVLGIRKLLPPEPSLPMNELGFLSPEAAEAAGLSPDTRVTLGIHDSNSSLIPYLITRSGDFVLNSTGTWCVAMHPEKALSFAPDELGKMVYYNLSYRGRPVKTSILMGGLEYETYADFLRTHHGRTGRPPYDPRVYREILEEADSFVLPSVVPGTGQFPNSAARVVEGSEVHPLADILSGERSPRVFGDFSKGFALVNLSLALQTRVALQRVGLRDGTEVYVEGGFRRNENYIRLLGALLPNNPLFLTSLDEASSFGAALCGKALMDGRSLETLAGHVKLDKRPVRSAELEGLEEYAEVFFRLAAGI